MLNNFGLCPSLTWLTFEYFPVFAREECSTVPLNTVTVSDATSQLHNAFHKRYNAGLFFCLDFGKQKTQATIIVGKTVNTMINMSTYI